MKRLLVTALALFGMTGATFASAGAASAATDYAYTYFSNGSISEKYVCGLARTYLDPPTPMAFINNMDCTGRIWIHQYAGGGGWNECINPFNYAVIPSAHLDPGNIQVTTVHTACP